MNLFKILLSKIYIPTPKDPIPAEITNQKAQQPVVNKENRIVNYNCLKILFWS